ncbi:MAG: hypothetical protein JWO02_4138 [Solirubrobacterales bacterium]|nr:hypothetical protein [Solirubrobacterales bacterium]
MLRRSPAFLWLPVYLASLLILNGAHGSDDLGQLAVGVALTLIAFGIGLRLALGYWEDHPRPNGLEWFIGGVGLFYAVTALTALLFSWEAAMATLLAALIPATAVTLWIASARATTVGEPGQYRDASAEDHEDPWPGVGLDASRPLGDTPDVHDDLIPHDLPKGHPARKALEHQAAEHGGVTPGNKEGAADREAERSGAQPLVDDTERHNGARVRHR